MFQPRNFLKTIKEPFAVYCQSLTQMIVARAYYLSQQNEDFINDKEKIMMYLNTRSSCLASFVPFEYI